MRTTDEDAGVRRPPPAAAGDSPGDRELLRHRLLALWRGRAGDRLDAIAEHALVPPGKLLRPLLVLESARCAGGSPEGFADLALAIEYLHVATLVHDDIIDEDDTRRGRPSVHAAFGVPSAIVGGDGLILETFAALTGPRPDGVPDADVLAVVAVLADAGLTLCRGQLLESELTGDLNCTVDRYLTMARMKTGALFEAACRIGGILGRGKPEWTEALGMFGRRLGIAFQIRDDLLAFDGTTALIGKPRDSDLQNARPTLPMLLAYRRASDGDRADLERVFAEESPDAASYDLVRGIVARTGAREATREHAAEMIRRAKRCLAELPPGPSAAALAGIADFALGRSS